MLLFLHHLNHKSQQLRQLKKRKAASIASRWDNLPWKSESLLIRSSGMDIQSSVEAFGGLGTGS